MRKGLARTQIPTNKNDDVEFPTFGEFAGVNRSQVQWSSLALEEPPSWSWLKTSRPGKYAIIQCLENFYRGDSLAPHLSPAVLSPASTMKRKLRNVSMENESFHDQQWLETSTGTSFQTGSDHFFTGKCFRRNKYAPCGSRVTLQYHSHHQRSIRLSVLNFTFANGHITEVQQLWASKILPMYLLFRALKSWPETRPKDVDWEWGSEPIFAVLQCKANSW